MNSDLTFTAVLLLVFAFAAGLWFNPLTLLIFIPFAFFCITLAADSPKEVSDDRSAN